MSIGAFAIVVVIALVVKNRHVVDEKKKRALVLTEIKEIRTDLDRYYLDHGYYPTTDQGLGSIFSFTPDPWDLDPGILRSAPPLRSPKLLDPWGHPFEYESDGDAYILKSLGPNGTKGKVEGDFDLTITGGFR